MVLAGEESGDLHGAAVVGALSARFPSARFIGLGGPRLAEQGVELLAGLDRLAVMGFAEPIRHLPFFLRLFGRIRGLLRSGKIDLVIAVDYPGFNLRVVEVAKELGVPVLYYIVPQFWAWKKGRVDTLARDADRIAVILPFEERALREAGAEVSFVGHPLVDRLSEPTADRDRFLRGAGLDPARPVLALFPGSRHQEIRRHLPVFLDAARQLVAAHPHLQVAVARARSIDGETFEGSGVATVDHPAELLRHSYAAIVKSGTSTLEAAVAGVPSVCVYQTHPITYFVAKRLVEIPFIALPNLVAEREVMPELVQEEVSPETIAARIEPLLEEGSAARVNMIRGFAEVRARLGEPGAAERVAVMAEEMLVGGGSRGDTATSP